MARDIRDVIAEVRKHVPIDREAFLSDLRAIEMSANYASPELVGLGWERLETALECEMGFYPKEDWQFEVCSIVTTVSVKDLRASVKDFMRHSGVIENGDNDGSN